YSCCEKLAQQHHWSVLSPDASPRGEDIADDDAYDLGQGAGFYLKATQEPWANHYKMYDYLVNELGQIAADLIPHFAGQESIMGHSMGGHGALVIGLKNANRFKAISDFAAVLKQ